MTKIYDVPTLHALGAESGVEDGIDELFTGETPGLVAGESLTFAFPLEPGRLYLFSVSGAATEAGGTDGAQAAVFGGAGNGIQSVFGFLKDLSGLVAPLGSSEILRPPLTHNGPTWTLVVTIVTHPDTTQDLAIVFTDTGSHAKVNVAIRVTGYSVAQPTP